MTAAPKAGGLAAPLRVLLAGAIDYAGLFPPAGLPMISAVKQYLSYRESADRWALGRLVVPASRLADLAEALRAAPPSAQPIPISVIIGANLVDDLRLIEGFDFRSGASIESVEVKARSGREVSHGLGDIPFRLMRYVEVPTGHNADPVLHWVALARVFAKVRTGGTTIEAFPSLGDLLQFLTAAVRHRVPFKATAGLHHPLRGSYRLTNEADAPRGPMYGYLNLALAAAVLWRHGSSGAAAAEAALIETAPGAIHVDAGALGWRSERFEPAFLAAFRRDFFHGFGSCSFREPLDELTVLTAAR